MIRGDPSRSELIRPGLAVRVGSGPTFVPAYSELNTRIFQDSFVRSPLVFVGVPVSCFQSALLRGSFEQGSGNNLILSRRRD